MNPGTLSDVELVRAVLAGRLDLYEEIVNRHQRAVWWIASRLLADAATTQNIVQQCFVNAYEHLAQFRQEEDLGRWLRGIARNLVRLELRSAARRDRLLEDYHRAVLAELDAADEANADARQRALVDAMAECRKALLPVADEAITLRYEQGLAIEDVARRLGRTLGATRQLLFRARELLRACLDGKLDGEVGLEKTARA